MLATACGHKVANILHHRNVDALRTSMSPVSKSSNYSRCPIHPPSLGESPDRPSATLTILADHAPLLCSIFQPSWDKILRSTDATAASHHLFAQHVEKDVEQALRQFQNRKDVQNMHTMATNLATMARELEDAKEKVEKLSKKGGKASALKVDTATARLESASSQWESQAPFILETLQALDEQRCNHLRDVLTQFETHEVDQSDRLRASANDALATIVEADTSSEIGHFANKVTAGKPKVERRTPTERTPTVTRQSTSTNNQPPSTADSSLAPPTSFSQMTDNRSNHSLQDEKSGMSLRLRGASALSPPY